MAWQPVGTSVALSAWTVVMDIYPTHHPPPLKNGYIDPFRDDEAVMAPKTQTTENKKCKKHAKPMESNKLVITGGCKLTRCEMGPDYPTNSRLLSGVM